MTATDELRSLLDERGVEWHADDHDDIRTTTWRFGNQGLATFSESADGECAFIMSRMTMTPEQAIAATMGAEEAYTRDDVEGAFVSGYSLGLDMFDSSKPDGEKGWNQNERNLDEEMEDLGWVRKEAATLGPTVTGETSDGYHTFNELYHHRAVLFSVVVRDHPKLAWKSKLHSDGTMYDGMFIVGIETQQGQATYHYDIEPYWEMFDCKELERAPEWDGHTSADAIARIATLRRGECEVETTERWLPAERYHRCEHCGAFFAVLDASGDIPPRLCPNCGRRVMVVDE